MSNCNNHKKEIAGITDMKVLAEMIGDLHYETLAELLTELHLKIKSDGQRDYNAGRHKLGNLLSMCAAGLKKASAKMSMAWDVSEPFMKQ